jgi:hypothetical protein
MAETDAARTKEGADFMKASIPPRQRERFRMGLVCAACGLLVVPAIAAVIMLGRFLYWGIRNGHHRRAFVAVLAALVGIVLAVLSAWGMVEGARYFAYSMTLSWHTCYLSPAIHRYYDRHGRLADSLDELKDSGFGWPVAYVLESGSGYIAPHYLPVTDWDGETPFIVAVTGTSEEYPDRRGYVVLGDWGQAHYATVRDLRWMLKADDVVREHGGEPRRWKDVDWEGPATPMPELPPPPEEFRSSGGSSGDIELNCRRLGRMSSTPMTARRITKTMGDNTENF